MLEYLRKHHDISTKTIYNDLLGFIENRRIHKSGYTEFYKGFTCQKRVDSVKSPVEKRKWYDKAIEYYTEAVNLNSQNTEAYNNRGTAYSEIGEFDNAIQDFNIAIALKPELAEVYNNRGNAYRDKGEFDNAIQNCNTAIALNPELADAYHNRGWMWLHLREWEKARADLNTAKDMGNDIIAVFHNYYESVADFEAKCGGQVPEDLAALLSRNGN